jgi:hypothetical protein
MIGCERSRGCERSSSSTLLHTYMALQPNNERGGFAIFYSSAKQKIERFRSNPQTKNSSIIKNRVALFQLASQLNPN